MARPNILLILTDEERYPPPYETDAVRAFRRDRMPNRERLRDGGVELHRHYVGSTACAPSRATLFTGQYPSLHGVSQTDGTAKRADDPGMRWLDPDTVPTLGDWLRAGGYRTQYRGKWHVSHADLVVPGTHESLMASDDEGRPIPDAVAAYRSADRLDPFGFSGWIGREPHGPGRADTGTVRDGVIADQVAEMLRQLGDDDAADPWFAVASFVNPHDIAFAGGIYQFLLGREPFDDTVPEIPEAPSQRDSFAGRPGCQEQFAAVWPKMLAAQPADDAYRRLYYHLHQLVDVAIGQVLDALDASGMAEDTIVIFTSDHGDLLGAHGGLQQKWCNAFDEALHVPMVVKGADVAPSADGWHLPTSHADLVPTILGLAGVDVEQAAAALGRHHTEVHDLPGRDLSGLLTGRSTAEVAPDPVYFMTEDQISSGTNQANLITGEPFEPVGPPSCIESVVAVLPTGAGGEGELWKVSHYYERLDEWHADRGIAPNPFAPPAAEPQWELHNLTTDPEERTNLAGDAVALDRMRAVLEQERDRKRLLPRLRNPA